MMSYCRDIVGMFQKKSDEWGELRVEPVLNIDGPDIVCWKRMSVMV